MDPKFKKIRDDTSSGDGGSLVPSSNEKDYFSHLPEEIILEIFKYLPLQDIRKPVNKRWYEVSFNRLSEITIEDKIIESKHLKYILDCGVKVLRFKYCQIVWSSLQSASCYYTDKHMDAAKFDKLQHLCFVYSYINEKILEKMLTSHLKILELSGSEVGFKTFSITSKWEQLEELRLDCLNIKSNGYKHYEFDKLRSLHLRGTTITEYMLNELLASDLKVLELTELTLDNSDYNIFRKIFKMKHLEKLTLSCFHVRMSSMQDCEKFCTLRYVYLSQCYFGNPAELAIFLSCCSQLSYLSLSQCTFDDNIMREILDMKDLEHLEMFSHDIELTYDLKPEVHRDSFCNLRHLQLLRCRFKTTKTAQKFLAFFSHITHLCLGNLYVSSEVISHLNLYQLRYLKLYMVSFDSSETLEKLLFGCNQLTHLYLSSMDYTLNDKIFREILNMKELKRLELQHLKIMLTSSVKSISFDSLNFLRLNSCSFRNPKAFENLLSCCNKITHLVLDGNFFISYDADFRYIAEMQMLQYLAVYDTTEILSQETDLMECCPKRCVLTFSEECS